MATTLSAIGADQNCDTGGPKPKPLSTIMYRIGFLLRSNSAPHLPLLWFGRVTTRAPSALSMPAFNVCALLVTWPYYKAVLLSRASSETHSRQLLTAASRPLHFDPTSSIFRLDRRKMRSNRCKMTLTTTDESSQSPIIHTLSANVPFSVRLAVAELVYPWLCAPWTGGRHTLNRPTRTPK